MDRTGGPDQYASSPRYAEFTVLVLHCETKSVLPSFRCNAIKCYTRPIMREKFVCLSVIGSYPSDAFCVALSFL